MNETHLRSTRLLALDSPVLTALVAARGWRELPGPERIGAIHAFVRDEIRFGYNRSDDIAAPDVLRDGLGQCNTKATLLMALLRACGVACRLHGFTIDRKLQKG
ncbi:MAG: transglutaminase family protein, partial [Myxococcales bacterium]